MATEKRMIDANACPCAKCDRLGSCRPGFCEEFAEWWFLTVDAVEVVHSRFVRIADFGDGEGCFGYCERCGTVHHAQSPVALKADHRWCIWCGAKMDGDGNG